jgi:hypothetical protein
LSISGWPNVRRSRQYAIVASISSSSPRGALAAAYRRSSWNCTICIVNPMPSSPMRWRWGTRTSSKYTGQVSEERRPSLSILGPTVTPGVRVGTTISDLFAWGEPSLVLTSTHVQSDWLALVIHIFEPLIT